MAYSQEIADAICERLSNGESLRAITKDVGASQAEVFRWLADEANEAFREQYARAREAQADHYASEIIDIADEDCAMVKHPNGEDGEVEVAFDSTAVARNRLRVDARKWYASKLAPKKYGDKITNEHTGPNGGPVQIVATEHDENL